MSSLWLRSLFGVGLLGAALPGFSQTLTLPPDLEQAYPATPLPHENLVRTAEGCGVFVSRADPVLLRKMPDIDRIVAENWKRYRWSGLCPDGLMAGPGELQNISKDGTLGSTSTWWTLRGRPIGEAVTQIETIGPYRASTSWNYTWKGTNYSRNVPLNADVVQIPGADRFANSASYNPVDRKFGESWNLDGPRDGSGATLVRSALTDKYLASGVTADRLTQYPCPAAGCDALWRAHVVPVLKAYAEFRQRSEPEVAAAKAVVLAAIGPQLKQRELELKQAALKKAPAVAAAKQAQRKEAVSAANRCRI